MGILVYTHLLSKRKSRCENMNYKEMEELFIYERLNNDLGYEILSGTNNIMLSAPHSVSQIREGKVKTGEYRTGLIVKLLKERTASHSIYKTACLQDDANYDDIDSCKYKENLISYIENHDIAYLFDFHISAPSRHYDIDIGTAFGVNIQHDEKLLEVVTNILKKYYENVLIDDTFPASYRNTVSATLARENHIPCLQIEINWNQLNTFEKVEKFLTCMEEVVKDVENNK